MISCATHPRGCIAQLDISRKTASPLGIVMRQLSTSSKNLRSALRAVILGVGVGVVLGLILTAAIYVLALLAVSLFDLRGSWAAVDLAGILVKVIVFGMPMLPLAGGLLGGFLLKEKRKARFTWCMFPLAILPLGALLGGLAAVLWVAVGQDAWKQMQNARQAQWAIVNESTNDLFNIALYTDPMLGPGFYVGDHPPQASPAAQVSLSTSDTMTPRWSADRTIVASWQRIVTCYEPNQPHCGGNGDLLSANVHLPRYSGSWNKAFIIIFLPEDKVRIEVVDRRSFNGRVVIPANDVLVTQGIPRPQN